MRSESDSSRWAWTIFAGALAWLLIAGLLLLEMWPWLPQSQSQWILFLALGPPVYVFAQLISERAFSERIGYSIAPPGFSLRRVLVTLAFTLAFLCVGYGVVRLLKS